MSRTAASAAASTTAAKRNFVRRAHPVLRVTEGAEQNIRELRDIRGSRHKLRILIRVRHALGAASSAMRR